MMRAAIAAAANVSISQVTFVNASSVPSGRRLLTLTSAPVGHAHHHHHITHHYEKARVVSYGMQVMVPRVNVISEIKGAKGGLHNLGYHLTKHKVPHHAWRELTAQHHYTQSLPLKPN